MITPKEALEITKRYWKDVPVDVFAIARDLGLGPRFDDLSDNISGLIRRVKGDQWEIVVNAHHARVRQRFTVAHEIGHFIYHRNLLADGVSDTLAYRADGAQMPNASIGPLHERQANNFAANLLVPTHWLSAAKAVGLSDPKDLAKKFNVSETVMRIKMHLPVNP